MTVKPPGATDTSMRHLLAGSAPRSASATCSTDPPKDSATAAAARALDT